MQDLDFTRLATATLVPRPGTHIEDVKAEGIKVAATSRCDVQIVYDKTTWEVKFIDLMRCVQKPTTG